MKNKQMNLCSKKMFFMFTLILSAFFLSQAAYSAEPELNGMALYVKYCAPCHGEKGDGNGPLSKALFPKPRDFRTALYEIRSTSSDSPPSDTDILRTIKKGLPGTSMISWGGVLDDNQLSQLLPILKGFSKQFGDKPVTPIQISHKISNTSLAIANGQKIYAQYCFQCHGEKGNGNGPMAKDLSPRPRDLTKEESFFGGYADEDIYLRIATGLAGTAMPSFEKIITDEQKWELVYYVKSLAKDRYNISIEKEKYKEINYE